MYWRSFFREKGGKHMTFLLVGLGGGIGALLRVTISAISKKYLGHAFPYGTLIINILGSFALGILIGMNMDDKILSFFGMGVLGGFTTFATFSYEVVSMFKDKKHILTVLYIFLSYILGIGAAMLGFVIGR